MAPGEAKLTFRRQEDTRERATALSTKRKESFSFATCLFVALKIESRGRSLVLAREFGNQEQRWPESRERHANRKNSGALPRQRVGSEFIQKCLCRVLRTSWFRFVFAIEISRVRWCGLS